MVYASDETQAALAWLNVVLQPFAGIEWRTTNREFLSLGPGIAFRTLELGKSVAFQFHDEISGASVLIAPAVGQVTAELRDAIKLLQTQSSKM